MTLIRALYGSNSSGPAWRAMIAKTLLYLDYKPLRSDMNVWMNPETNPQTGKDYCPYALVYVDDCFYLRHDPEIFMKELKGVYRLKYGSLGPLT